MSGRDRSGSHFPGHIRALPPFDGPFDAGEEHSARFDTDTSEIEFWFRPQSDLAV